jgi:hypothetical protein
MINEKYYYIGMRGLQTSKLHDNQEQTDDAEQVRDKKVLQILPLPYSAQGNKIAGRMRAHFSTGQ